MGTIDDDTTPETDGPAEVHTPPRVPGDQWRFDVVTRDGTLDRPDALRDRVVYADVATLETVYDTLGPEAWRAMLAVLRRYTVVESRQGGQRLGVVGWGVAWVEEHTGMGNRPARRAVNALETANLILRDELPGTIGAAGVKVGLLDLSRVLTGARVAELSTVVPTGRRWSAGISTAKSVKTDTPEVSAQVGDVLAETPTRVLAEVPTRKSAKLPTRVLAETPTRRARRSAQVSDVLTETPTRLSTAPSRSTDREIERLLGLGGGTDLLAHGLRPALQADPQDVLDRLVSVVASGSSAPALARWLLDELGVDHAGASPVRYLLEAVLLDVYLANPLDAQTWLGEWGANVKRTPLTVDQLATRLVVAVVATLGLPDRPTALGGWFGAWCKPKPSALFANEAVVGLHELATSLAAARSQRTPHHDVEPDAANVPANAPDPTDTPDPSSDAEPAPVPDLTALSEATVRALWPQVVELFPKAADWADRPTSHVARGFLASFAAERPALVARALKAQTTRRRRPRSAARTQPVAEHLPDLSSAG